MSTTDHERDGAPARVCRFTSRCPMFPVFESQERLRRYQVQFCYDAHTACKRFKLASSGTMPPATLLPDGTTLPGPEEAST